MEYIDNGKMSEEKFRNLLRALDARELRLLLKDAYRAEGAKVKGMIARRAGNIGIRDGEKMARRSLRVFAYTKGGGFMVSANPRNKQGYYMTRQDRKKPQDRWRLGHPVGMFLNSGSWKSGRRQTKKGWNRGRLYGYHFVENGERDALEMVRRDLMEELERKLRQRIGKRGFVMG